MEMLYGCPFEKITFLSRIDTNSGFGGFSVTRFDYTGAKSHVIPYEFKCSHWMKLQHLDWRANLVKDFFLQMNFPPMGALEFT